MFPSSGNEAPYLIDSLDRAILSQWPPQKHSTCSDMRLRTHQTLFLLLPVDLTYSKAHI
jgi:hypothetical protein